MVRILVVDRRIPVIFLIITILLLTLLSGYILLLEDKKPKEGTQTDPYVFFSDLFNTPTWDATYINESIMDQFTAGFSYPDFLLFNVTSDRVDTTKPSIYWRLSTLDTYAFTNKAPYSTDWDASPIIYQSDPANFNSQKILETDRTARYTIEIPLDYNTSDVDVTLNPNFVNILPTAWNGIKGSYVDSDSFELYDSNRSLLPVVNKRADEGYSSDISTEDIRGIRASIQVSETSIQLGYFKYIMDYESPGIQKAASFSLTREENIYEQIMTSDSWSYYKERYLQIPTNLPEGYNNYQEWAPTVNQIAHDLNDSTLSVFDQVYTNMLIFENFTFDQDMWIGEQTVGQMMAHPSEYEDYNEWFLKRESGVSIHFASLLAAFNRLQGIPSRLVIGYLPGNDSYVYNGKRVITMRDLHAWVETLIPIDPNSSISRDEYVEWVGFDPLMNSFSHEYGFSNPTDIISLLNPQLTTFIRPDYDLETNGIAGAHINHSVDQDVFNRCIVNNSVLPNASILHHGETVNVSVRLIHAPSLTSWSPCSGVNISFYLGSKMDNNASENIEDGGIYLGGVITDVQGTATLIMTIDVTVTGIRMIQFFTVMRSIDGSGNLVRREASSQHYDIFF
jgi:transglutaminase-like putative cysteine protease